VPQTLTEIKALLQSRAIQPRHRFGQNFLVDANKMAQIVELAEVGEGETVLEVGPGTGALTEGLLAVGARVVAVEIDRDLCAILRKRLGGNARFTLIEADAMAGKSKLNPAIDAALGGRDTPFAHVANLPYNIASPLLATLTLNYPGMRRAVVMVQREVADRLVAAPGGKTYGPISVTLQATCAVRIAMTLPPSCFWPRPKVDSAVVEITRRDEPLTDDPRGLAKFTQRLFQQRRKQIGSILGRDRRYPDNVAPTTRPENLSLEQLAALMNTDQ
jgi:16S rRNA (adenine1518-N6/adenine1519-N6)-dimethyltransferase